MEEKDKKMKNVNAEDETVTKEEYVTTEAEVAYEADAVVAKEVDAVVETEATDAEDTVREAEVAEAESLEQEKMAEDKVTERKETAEKVVDGKERKKSEKKAKVESKEQDEKKKNDAVVDARAGGKSRSGNAAAVVMSAVALVLAGTGAVFSFLAYQRVNPIAYFNSGSGNTVSFVEGSIADIADKVSKSVVSILTSTRTVSYFGGATTSEAAGTGIIVTSDGYILTNKHVIDGASAITVVLDDGTTYSNVSVAAVDPLNDVAFLKIKDVTGLTPATLGDSKTLTAGQQVIAIGNALGQYQNTVTAGVISGTGRSLTATDATGSMAERLTDMIQTDAAINSGNSGGPLVNGAGEVIGMNTANTYGGENVGFAIPISSVKGMLKQLITEGKAERAYIGAYYSTITPDVAKQYNLPVSNGAYLYSSGTYSAIVTDSPAAKAGLKDKDIIVAVNGAKVGVAGSLSSLIGEYKPGDKVTLDVIREGNSMQVEVTLGAYKDK
ncbi:trypsin-like peptidase domain-containing protein [Candidatus Saccharibacteria bacterium]|nr:trypsin-like peptidase domain-containing protein [Candidatus Saccharibacteria bacterium]